MCFGADFMVLCTVCVPQEKLRRLLARAFMAFNKSFTILSCFSYNKFVNILSEDSSSIMLVHPFSVYWLISYFIVMAPDVTISSIRTVAMVIASSLLQSVCYCQESMQP